MLEPLRSTLHERWLRGRLGGAARGWEGEHNQSINVLQFVCLCRIGKIDLNARVSSHFTRCLTRNSQQVRSKFNLMRLRADGQIAPRARTVPPYRFRSNRVPAAPMMAVVSISASTRYRRHDLLVSWK